MVRTPEFSDPTSNYTSNFEHCQRTSNSGDGVDYEEMRVSSYGVQIHYCRAILRSIKAWNIEEKQGRVQEPEPEKMMNHDIPRVVS